MRNMFSGVVRLVRFAAIVIVAGFAASACSGGAAPSAPCGGADSFFIAGCCGAPLAACLKRHPPCPLAVHMGAFASWLDTLAPVSACSTRIAALAARQAFFTTDTGRGVIDDDSVAYAGMASSPCKIILYVSALCPLCKRVYKDLYAAVTEGALKGIARLGIKVITAREWDLALLAARRVNKQSALFLSLAGVEERISMPIIRQKAAGIGLSPAQLDRLLADSSLLQEGRRSAIEAARNGVRLTPTVFIGSRRYRSYKDPQWIIDAVLCLHESAGPSRPERTNGQLPGDR
jgi:hypothetical protein